jgi:sugar (pentulose or hexulose) kinase
MPNPPKRIIATGGASSNGSILKSIAQIFGSPVFTVQRPGMETVLLDSLHKLGSSYLSNSNEILN